MAGYTIKLPVFEGPFDLLLHLIRVNEMDIHDISISEITTQYLDFIRVYQELDLELAGEFLVMAATLINIKARMLLPVPPDESEKEEELDEIMTARDLVRQLVEYRKFKEAAQSLRHREEEASRIFYRTNVIDIEPETTGELSLDVSLLYKAFARVINYVDSPTYTPELGEKFTVEDKVSYITDVVQRDAQVDLFDLFRRCFNRAEIVVTFLAVLELVRLGQVQVAQENAFDRIVLQPATTQLEHGAS